MSPLRSHCSRADEGRTALVIAVTGRSELHVSTGVQELPLTSVDHRGMPQCQQHIAFIVRVSAWWDRRQLSIPLVCTLLAQFWDFTAVLCCFSLSKAA